jgi:hypothetical protein
MVVVCPYCRSVVARGDRKLEDLGKVAALAETGSLLAVGLKGRYQGVPFELTGRAQLGHPAGGLWDEWYAHFADGRWGWVAEAQGRFYVTFRTEPASRHAVPDFIDLHVGRSVTPAAGVPPLIVAEKANAKYLSAEGEIPYRLVPGETYNYADLSGPNGEFGTFDYSEQPPLVFAGRQVTLDELGIPPNARPRAEEHRVEGIQVSCPQCGGPLELRAPDRTERVGCPNCGALLDCRQGELRFLQALKHKVRPELPLGSVGSFEDEELTVIGFFVRSVKIEGTRYSWNEYLLYHPRLGFRWLTSSDHHWNYVRPVEPGAVQVGVSVARYRGQEFKLFQRAVARVDYVMGECYWKVSAGEEVTATDYVRPPEMLSREWSRSENVEEINWSLGTYVPVEEIEQTFNVSLPRPTTVGPNQPFPNTGIYRAWAWLAIVLGLVGFFFLAFHPQHRVYEKTIPLSANPAQTFFSDPFELQGHGPVKITVRAAAGPEGVDIGGNLVSHTSAPVAPFSLPLAGDPATDTAAAPSRQTTREISVQVSAPPGRYTLKLEFHHPQGQQPPTATVRVAQGGARFLYWFLAFLGVSVIPVGVGFAQMSFEQRRWQDSSIT